MKCVHGCLSMRTIYHIENSDFIEKGDFCQSGKRKPLCNKGQFFSKKNLTLFLLFADFALLSVLFGRFSVDSNGGIFAVELQDCRVNYLLGFTIKQVIRSLAD